MKTEGKDDLVVNLLEDDYSSLNNSKFKNMDLQWFADPDPGEGDPNPGEGDPEPTGLSGLWAGATAEQRETNGEIMKGFSKLPELFDSYMDLKSKAENGIVKPGEGATEDEVAVYKESLGIPAKAEDYELDSLPEGFAKDEALENWFRQTALSSDMSAEQAKGVYKAWNQLVVDRTAAIATERAEGVKKVETELRKEYGDEYDKNVAMAKRIMFLGGGELTDYLEETGLGNDPRITRVMVGLGRMISEDSLDSIHDPRGEPVKKSQAEIMYGKKTE